MKKIAFLQILLLLVLETNYLFSQVPSYVPANGLVGWWPFNGNANDLSGNGNNGIVNGPISSPDRFNIPNNSYYFSSSNCSTRIDINNFNYNGTLSAFSISFWIKRVGNGCISPRLFEFGNGTGWGVNWNNGSSNMDWVTGLNIANNSWFHLVYIIQPGQIKSYVNGVFNSQYVYSSSLATSFTQQVCFGRMNHPSYDAFNGNLDDVGTWNRALTECEIQQLYLSQLNPLNVNAGQDQTICSGSSVTLTATGADTYSWNGGIQNNVAFTPTISGQYIVTGSNSNGCTGIDTVNITVVPSPIIVATNDTLCLGQMSTLMSSINTNFCDLSGSLTNGLVGYWPFCGNANDESGNGNHGNVMGSVLTSDRNGTPNNAYLFDGVNDFISLTNSFPNTNSFTISAWVYHTKGNNYSGILSDATTFPGNDLYINVNVQSIGIKADKDGSSLFQCPLPEVGYNPTPFATGLNIGNQWKHIVLEVNQTQSKLYINSVLVSNLNIGGSNVGFHALNPVFGKITDGAYSIQFFGGKLDDIGIWNRALTSAEIQQLYTQGQTTLLWSPGGETTTDINVSPTTTTNYTCTATTNGVSCSQSQIIEVLQPSSSILNVTECNSYTFNGQNYTQSGVFTEVIPNVAGCDSTITLNLTLNSPPTTPNIYIQNQTTLSTDSIPGLSYQWFFCTDLIDVPGATNPTFTPTANAYYAVVVSNACGSDTSACAEISSTGLNVLGNQNVQLFPNPTKSSISVSVPSHLQGQRWELLDIQGRLVLNGKVEDEYQIIDLGNLASGSFWLRISTLKPLQVIKN